MAKNKKSPNVPNNSALSSRLIEQVGASFSKWLKLQLEQGTPPLQTFDSKQALVSAFLEYYKTQGNHKAADISHIIPSDFNELYDVLATGNSDLLDLFDESHELSDTL
jgi:hypothetical protein